MPLALTAAQVASTALYVLLMRGAPPGGLVNDTVGWRAIRRLALFDGPPEIARPSVWAIRAALSAMVLVHVAALVAARKTRTVSPWIVGPVASAALLLAMPPPSADPFTYGVYVGAHLTKYADIRTTVSPYGPVWTLVSHVVVDLTGRPMSTLLAFRALALAGTAALTVLAYRASGRSAAAAVAVMWSPVLLVESAAGGHNDAVVAALATAGLAASSATLVLVSALTKPVSAVLLPIVLRRRRPWDLVAASVVGLVGLAGGTAWVRSAFGEAGRLAANPVWLVLHVPRRAAIVAGLALAAVGIAAGVVLARRSTWTGAACALASLAFLPANAHAWYGIWPLAPAAVAFGQGSRRWPLALLAWSGLVLVAYHTRAA